MRRGEEEGRFTDRETRWDSRGARRRAAPSKQGLKRSQIRARELEACSKLVGSLSRFYRSRLLQVKSSDHFAEFAELAQAGGRDACCCIDHFGDVLKSPEAVGDHVFPIQGHHPITSAKGLANELTRYLGLRVEPRVVQFSPELFKRHCIRTERESGFLWERVAGPSQLHSL